MSESIRQVHEETIRIYEAELAAFREQNAALLKALDCEEECDFPVILDHIRHLNHAHDKLARIEDIEAENKALREKAAWCDTAGLDAEDKALWTYWQSRALAAEAAVTSADIAWVKITRESLDRAEKAEGERTRLAEIFSQLEEGAVIRNRSDEEHIDAIAESALRIQEQIKKSNAVLGKMREALRCFTKERYEKIDEALAACDALLGTDAPVSSTPSGNESGSDSSLPREGSPAKSKPHEWIRYCLVCGMVDTCEDPHPPCPGANDANS